MGVRDLLVIGLGIFGVLTFFAVLRSQSPEQFAKKGEVKKQRTGEALGFGLSFLASGIALLLEFEHVSPAAGIFALGGLGVGVLASGILLLQRTLFIRPKGWTEVDGHQWWKKIDDLELFFGGLGGPVDRNWDVSRLEIINRTNDDVVIENLRLQANGTAYTPECVSSHLRQDTTVGRGRKRRLISLWRFTSPLYEVYHQGAILTVSVRCGGELRKISVELNPE